MLPRVLFVALTSIVMLSGCGGDPAGALPASRQEVRSTAEDVAGSLSGPGQVVAASGKWSVCSAGTSDRLEYAARLRLRADGDPVELVRAVGRQMEKDGWEATGEGDTSVNLARDGMRASARPSRATPDQVAVEVSGGCVDGSRGDVDSLEPEPIDVG